MSSVASRISETTIIFGEVASSNLDDLRHLVLHVI